MSAFYNEIDPVAAQWLRNLIAAGHIADGVVDERSIEDIKPEELRGFTQCHFFAGIGGWPLALRRAGWPDDRPIWTGSCPCQPFSAAGTGAGFADERHLWPAFFHLIEQCRPAVVAGEQVASKAVDEWVDLVQADLEAVGYAFGAVPFPSAGVGAPHIRDRCYWVADAGGFGHLGQRLRNIRGLAGTCRCEESQGHQSAIRTSACGAAGGLGDTLRTGLAQRQRLAGVPGGAPGADQGQAVERAGVHAGGVADANGDGSGRDAGAVRCAQGGSLLRADGHGSEPRGAVRGQPAPGPVNGLWAAADWLLCRDGKWRPVEPGAFPLAHGATARVGRLRAYGNAINVEAAVVFIEAYVAARRERSGLTHDVEDLA